MKFNINKRIDNVTIDEIIFESSGIITVCGWSKSSFDLKNFCHLVIDAQQISILDNHWSFRPDVAIYQTTDNFFCGFECSFFTATSLNKSMVSLKVAGESIWNKKITHTITPPHYLHMLKDADVQKREQIYCFGAPSTVINEEVRYLLHNLIDNFVLHQETRPVLDLGCGRGNVVQYLRQRGVKSYGIEMDRPGIHETLLNDVKNYVQLYAGGTPLPYNDDEFSGVVSIEVMEHIDQFEAMFSEVKRIAKDFFFLTVPDASAIARLYPQGVVPWHILESTHLNFFNQSNLERRLKVHWKNITFFKVNTFWVNDSRYSLSLVALCTDKI